MNFLTSRVGHSNDDVDDREKNIIGDRILRQNTFKSTPIAHATPT